MSTADFSKGKIKGIKLQNVPEWLLSLLLIIVISSVFPVIISSVYLQGIAVNILVYSIIALGLQLMMGYSGQISLGQAAFLGVGAYVSAILLKAGIPFWFVLPIAGLAAGVMGFIMSPIVRLKGVYFAVATLAFNVVLSNVFNSWDSVTNGVHGIMGIPKPALGEFSLQSPYHFFVLSLVILLICKLVSSQIVNSGYGRSLLSIKDNDIAALASGINVTGHKMQVIFVGSFFAGLAGAVMATYRGFVSPEPFAMSQSFFIVSMLVVGGIEHPFGPIAGAIAMTIVSEYISLFAGAHRVLVYGLILLFFVMFLPKGLMGIFEWIIIKVKKLFNGKDERL